MSLLWNIGRQQGRIQRRSTSTTIITCKGIINNYNVITPSVTRSTASISAATETASSIFNRICNPLIFQQQRQRKSFSSSAGSSSTVDDNSSINKSNQKQNQLPVVLPKKQHPTQIQLRRLPSIHYIPRSDRLGKQAATNDPEGRVKRSKRTSPNRDVNFDIDLWNRHKSPYRHLRHWIQIYKSSQLQRLIFPDLTIVFTLACGLTYYNEAIVGGIVENQVYLGQTYGTIGAAIALLTGFRTSASYGRYQEARQMWGEITNASRDLARQVMMFIPPSSSSNTTSESESDTNNTNTNTNTNQQQQKRRLLRLVKSYPIALNFYLTTKGGHPGLSRKSKNFTKQRYVEFETELLDIAYNDLDLDLDLDQQQQQQDDDNDDDDDDDNVSIVVKDKDLIRILDSFKNGSHTPIVVLTCLSEAIMDCERNNDIDPMFIRTMDIQISRLVGSNGERILRTPIPTGFTRHASRLLGFFCYVSPFAIYTFFGIYTPFSSCLVSYSLLAIEDIGVTLEEPFHVLPLRQYSDGIADTVDQIANTYSYDDDDDDNDNDDNEHSETVDRQDENKNDENKK